MYDAKSAGADAYRDLADEVLRQDGFVTDSDDKEKNGSVDSNSKKGNGNKETDKKKSKGFFGRRKED
jgi:chromosome partitioning protein